MRLLYPHFYISFFLFCRYITRDKIIKTGPNCWPLLSLLISLALLETFCLTLLAIVLCTLRFSLSACSSHIYIYFYRSYSLVNWQKAAQGFVAVGIYSPTTDIVNITAPIEWLGGASGPPDLSRFDGHDGGLHHNSLNLSAFSYFLLYNRRFQQAGIGIGSRIGCDGIGYDCHFRLFIFSQEASHAAPWSVVMGRFRNFYVCTTRD